MASSVTGSSYLQNYRDIIRDAASANIKHISQQIEFIDFEVIEAGQGGSLKAARELAAISKSNYSIGLDRERLINHFAEYQIQYSEVDGKIIVEPQHQARFLQLLARKILAVQLREDGPEVFVVTGRRPL